MKNKKLRTPLLFKEGMGWLITGCCAVIFIAVPVFANPTINVHTNYDESVGDGVSCSGDFERPGSKDIQPLAKLDDTVDNCKHLGGYIGIHPQSESDFQMQYDTLRHYIETCTTSFSHNAFVAMDGDVQQTNTNDPSRYERYRNWLVSVVYLNTTDPYYFCSCVLSIANSFPDSGGFIGINQEIAVLKYLLEDSICFSPSIEKYYKSRIGTRHARWLLGDTTKAEDTTLPSLDQLGLGSLLHHSSVSPSNGSLPSIYLASFTSSPNPFRKETTLEFTLNRMTYTTISIYDELGRLVWGDGLGSSLEAGVHTIHIDASSFPSGTLYARISTGFGEVKTMKLVHEK